jgi:ligand-binding SRPBCC domain-containing protein
MNVFEYQFVVRAPVSAVSVFHHDPRVLKKLTLPPVFIQIHQFEPLAEGATAEYTLWIGPLPIPWTAVHSDVTEQGFTDTQRQGPFKRWQHTHRFEAVNDQQTLVKEHIEYVYLPGLRGLLSRLLFNRATLFFMFSARKWLTRRYVSPPNRRNTSSTSTLAL